MMNVCTKQSFIDGLQSYGLHRYWVNSTEYLVTQYLRQCSHSDIQPHARHCGPTAAARRLRYGKTAHRLCGGGSSPCICADWSNFADTTHFAESADFKLRQQIFAHSAIFCRVIIRHYDKSAYFCWLSSFRWLVTFLLIQHIFAESSPCICED